MYEREREREREREGERERERDVLFLHKISTANIRRKCVRISIEKYNKP